MSQDSTPPKAPSILRCAFYEGLSLDFGSCDETTDIVTGIRLCKKHMRYVARKAGYVPRHKVDEMGKNHAASELRILTAENDRLKSRIAWLQRSRPNSDTPTDGVVYFLRVGGFVKIGWTSNLQKRMRQYQPDSLLLAVKPGTRKDERALHRKFAHLLTHGREWFPLAPQITEEAARIVAEHGAPPHVDFSARNTQRIVGPRLNTGGPKPRTWVR